MAIEKTLDVYRSASLMRFATAGSVDDGKSTLIGRLLHDTHAIFDDQLAAAQSASSRLNRDGVDLALLLDGLRAEREQGITIDVAYRYFTTDKRRFIIADVPGHEQYTRNMVTGISTADLVVILVDASKGLTTQSKRHSFIASLLAIPHLVVAINKMDMVDYDEAVFMDLRAEYEAFAARLGIQDIHFIPMCAKSGENVVTRGSENMPWYEGKPLLNHLEDVYLGADRNLVDLRFPVQYVNRPSHDFRGYCGTIASGVIRQGDPIRVLPSGGETIIASVLGLDGPVPYASAGDAVTVTFRDEIDCSRGDLIVHLENEPLAAQSIELMVVWMHDTPMTPGTTYQIKHGTSIRRASVAKLSYRVDPNTLHREDADRLEMNEIGRVSLELYQALLHDPFNQNKAMGALIFIDPATNNTVGAGMIIDRRRRSSTVASPQAQAEPRSKNIVRQTGHVTRAERAAYYDQKPHTIWLTGLSGAGKSTIGFLLERKLMDMGRAVFVLDGDNVRHGLNRDLGFSPEDRQENLRRIAEVARLMNDAGLIVVTCFISPTIATRDAARQIIGDDAFVEVFIDTPISVCEDRDPKGLYKKARAGEIPNFTGISAPFEAPPDADITVSTLGLSPDESVQQILDALHLSPDPS